MRTRLGELAIRCSEHRLKRTRINREQEIAGLDDSAILKMDSLEITTDPAADIDMFRRVKAAGEGVPIGNALNQRQGDINARRARRLLRVADG